MVTGAVARGRYLGRVCVLSFRTHAEHVDWLVEDLGAALEEVTSGEFKVQEFKVQTKSAERP